MVNVKCPKCEHKFFVQARAELGEGSRKGRRLRRITLNKQSILYILSSRRNSNKDKPDVDSALTVREVQRKLWKSKTKRWNRVETKTIGNWNYHHVQAELSILRGADLVKMTKPKEKYDEQKGEFTTKPAPKYYMNRVQETRFLHAIKWNKGVL